MAQFLVPDSDVANDGWDDPDAVVVSPNLWQLVDDTIASADDDTGRLRSPNNPTSDIYTVGLTNGTDPASSSGHVMRARCRLSTISGDPTCTGTLELLQGASTVIATTSRDWVAGTDGTAWVTLAYTLTGTEADSITDYSDLRLRITANGTRRLQVTAMELEIPDAAAGGSEIVLDSIDASPTFHTIRLETDAQIAVPVSLISNAGGWDDPDGAVSGTDLWQNVDDGVTFTDDNTTKLRSPAGSSDLSDTIEFELGDVVDPVSGTGHTIRIRGREATTGLEHYIEFYLVQGTTVIATGSATWTSPDWQTAQYSLTTTEADSITDYTDLRIRVAARNDVGTGRIQVSGVELEVLSAGAEGEVSPAHLDASPTFHTMGVVCPDGVLSRTGADLYKDGTILNPLSPAEGLLMNIRVVQATVDFSAETEVSNWDAEANTDAFIDALSFWREHGVNCVVLNFQGGNFEAGWGESYDAGAWNSDGSLRAAHGARMARVINACLQNGITPMVGLTYFRQDQILVTESDVLAMVETAKDFLTPWKSQIIIEVTNESENALVSHAILQEDRNHEIVDDLEAAGFMATASHHSGVVPTVAQQGDGQIVTLHANGETEAGIGTMVASAISTFPSLNICINEDGATTRTATEIADRCTAAVTAGAGWGFHDPSGWQYWDGTNMTTMDWTPATSENDAGLDTIRSLTTPVLEIAHLAAGATFHTLEVADGKRYIDLAHHDASATFPSPTVATSDLTLAHHDASPTFHEPTVAASSLILEALDASPTFHAPTVIEPSATAVDLVPLDASATFHTGSLAGAVDLEAASFTATFHEPTVQGSAGSIDIDPLDASPTFHVVTLDGAVALAHADLSPTFHVPVLAASSLVLDILDAGATFWTVTVFESGFYPEIEIHAKQRGRYYRFGDRLVLVPLGRSVRRGYRRSDGWETVSGIFVFDNLETGSGSWDDVEAVAESVWAVHQGSDQATITAAMNTALHQAGFRAVSGGSLV